jgi:3-hydroxypropanoate dehydrogenase
MMSEALSAPALDQLFLDARSRNAWKPETLPEETWRRLYELVRHGPTVANLSPARFVFVTSEAAKARLLPHLSEANRAKSAVAPAIVIVAYDLDFAAKAAELFPSRPQIGDGFKANPEAARTAAFRSGSLQGAYLILAARALGLDAGPMSGFDNAGVDAEFFAGTNIKSNFVIALGHGVDTSYPRLPRLKFEDAAQIL